MPIYHLPIFVSVLAVIALSDTCKNGVAEGDTCSTDVDKNGVESGKLQLMQKIMKLAERSHHTLLESKAMEEEAKPESTEKVESKGKNGTSSGARGKGDGKAIEDEAKPESTGKVESKGKDVPAPKGDAPAPAAGSSGAKGKNGTSSGAKGKGDGKGMDLPAPKGGARGAAAAKSDAKSKDKPAPDVDSKADAHGEANNRFKSEGRAENRSKPEDLEKHAKEENPDGGIEEEQLAHYVVVPVGLAIVAALLAGGVLEKFHISFVPESAVTLGLGVVLGLYMKSNIGHADIFKHEEVFSETASTLLTLFLLPLLIFEPGWSMRVKDFASQFWYIMLFAVVGSLISFVVVGCSILWTGQQGLHSITKARTAFAYASLIAATDPVATLASFTKLKVDPLLNVLVMGDSIFNDAVAITLFKVLNSDDIMGTPESRPFFGALVKAICSGIVSIFVGSIAMGLCNAFLFLMLLRCVNLSENPRVEILAIVSFAYVNFAIAEVLGMSGIIATIFCSLLLGIYARPHLSKEGSMLGDFFIKQMACLMDTLVFLLTGFVVVMLDSNGLKFGCWVMLFCLVSRAASVFPVSLIINGIKRGVGTARGKSMEECHLLSVSHMFMIWHAGLRGAIALTLCMQLGPWVDILDGPGTRHILHSATYFLICVFLLVFGGSTEVLLKFFKIDMGKQTDPESLYRSEVHEAIQVGFASLDENVLVPLFIGDANMAAKIQESDKDTNVEDVLKRACGTT